MRVATAATRWIHRRSRPLASLIVTLCLAAWSMPASAEPTGICGTLRALRWPNAITQEQGVAVVADRTYGLSLRSWSDGTSVITRSALVGTQVCLTGELVPDTPNVITRFSLDGCAACAPDVESTIWPLVPLTVLGLGALVCVVTARRGPSVHRPSGGRRAAAPHPALHVVHGSRCMCAACVVPLKRAG